MTARGLARIARLAAALAVVAATFGALGPAARAQQAGSPAPGGGRPSPLPSGQPTGPGAQPGDQGPGPRPGETSPPPSGPTREPLPPERRAPTLPPLQAPVPATRPPETSHAGPTPTGSAGIAPLPGATAATATRPTRGALALTLKEAIVRALRHNPELAIDRITAEIALIAVDIPRGAFEPSAFSDGSLAANRDPFFAANPFGGPINPITGLPPGLVVNPSDASHLDGGVRERTIFGTSLELRYDVTRRTSENIFALSPAWSPAATASVTQPLLRGGPLLPLGVDVNRAAITIARNDQAISEEAFRDRALALAFAVEQAYWTCVFAQESVKVAELALAAAKDLLDIDRRKLQAGRLAEIEVLVAETGVATREEAVIVARSDVESARDALFRLIMPAAGLDGGPPARGRASAWDLELITLDAPRADDRPVDVDAAFALALAHRPDYHQLELALSSDETRITRAWNDRLPRLDAVGSWSELGLGKSWGGSTTSLGDREFYDWSVGLQLEVPIFNTAAEASLRQAELGRAANRRRLEALEQGIILDVRTAARNVVTARERVRTSAVARRLAEQQLANERELLEAGRATNHDVLVFEQDLTAARTNAIKAEVDQAVAAAQLDRVTATLLERYDIREAR